MDFSTGTLGPSLRRFKCCFSKRMPSGPGSRGCATALDTPVTDEPQLANPLRALAPLVHGDLQDGPRIPMPVFRSRGITLDHESRRAPRCAAGRVRRVAAWLTGCAGTAPRCSTRWPRSMSPSSTPRAYPPGSRPAAGEPHGAPGRPRGRRTRPPQGRAIGYRTSSLPMPISAWFTKSSPHWSRTAARNIARGCEPSNTGPTDPLWVSLSRTE
jgi:hypothetical protein